MTSTDWACAVLATPFGHALFVACDEAGVRESRWVRRAVPRALPGRAPALLREARSELQAYFAHRLRRFEVPLSLRGTPFELAVWSAVASLETSQLASYSDIARAIGHPRAHRGVARAMSVAPLALFVPAHRIVGADGRLRGACEGSMRRRLLRFEGIGIR